MKNWIKICGIQRPEDAQRCFDLGASAIGLNLWSRSPRSVSLATAAQIADHVRGKGDIVMLSVNQEKAALLKAIERINPTWVQFHGDEPPQVTIDLGPIAFKALGLATPQDVAKAQRWPGSVVLIDARDAVLRGGTGKSPPQELARAVCAHRPTILAGGLRPDNVLDAIVALGPVGVDTASGVEKSKGILDFNKVEHFIKQAQKAFLIQS